MMTLRRTGSVLVLLALALGGCASSSGSTVAQSATSAVRASADIVETATAAGSFNTLLAALRAADLVDTLRGDGPFTVFAPTDAAFAALPAGTVENLLRPENREQLRAVLTYHVVAGEVRSSQVVNLTQAQTVQGSSVRIRVENGQVRIDEATVVTSDVEASNGVIHVIDRVILPPAN